MGEGPFRFGGYELDEARRELRFDGVLQHVEPQVFDVLAYLIRHRDRVVTKTELLDEVWGSRFVSESALTSRIKAARQAVGDTGREQAVIRTAHGRGYRFVAAEPDSRITDAPALVGRSFPLDRLQQRLAEADAGCRRTVVVVGEAGIGKTALVETFVDSLDEDRVLVARGRCVEARGAAEPYLPVFDVLSRMCRGPAGQHVVDVLAMAAPSWLFQMPSLLDGALFEQVRERSVGTSGPRMLRELVDALELLSSDRTVVLVLEDIHWSDPPTLGALEWLAGRMDPARLLMIATSRPDPVALPGAEVLPLDRLRRDEVAQWLEALLPGIDSAVADLVHERSAGVPLFVRDLVCSWEDGDVPLTDVDAVAAAIPPSVEVLVEQDIARLPEDDVTTLEAAAVAGVEFSSAAAAAATGESEEAVEERCAALARRGLLLRSGGVVTWADGTASATFEFLHQFHHQVLHDRVPPRRRARYHLAVGECLEQMYGAQAGEHVGALAMHFDLGGDAVRAAEYLRRTAEQANVVGACHEALAHTDAGLRHAARIEDPRARGRAELLLLLTRASAMIVTHGWGAPELDATYRRAAELSADLGDPPEGEAVIVGLATLAEMLGRHQEAADLVAPRLGGAPTPLVVETHEVIACSSFHLGRFEEAIDHARRGLAHYRPDAPNEEQARHGFDTGVLCHGWAAFSSWFLGRSEDARTHLENAHASVDGKPHATASALVASAVLEQYRREPDAARQWAEAAIEVAEEHGYPFRMLEGNMIRGWALAVSGDDEQGIAALRAGLENYRLSGAFIEWPYYLGLLADALLHAGEPAEALEHLTAAFEAAASRPGYYYEPELQRLRTRALEMIG